LQNDLTQFKDYYDQLTSTLADKEEECQKLLAAYHTLLEEKNSLLEELKIREDKLEKGKFLIYFIFIFQSNQTDLLP
jgi:hypothetical protein